MLVLLPALAWLQYSWLEQIAAADRDRRERTLQTAASQLAQELDGELAKAVAGLQIESSMVEQQSWANYASRYQAWAETAIAPEIVKAIYFIEGPELHRPAAAAPPSASAGNAPVLRVWNALTRAFEVTAWPPELQNVRMRFLAGDRRIEIQPAPPGRGRGGAPRFERMILPPTPAGDEQSIVVPVLHFTPRDDAPPDGPPPMDVRMLGFTVLRLDLKALGNDVLPELVRRHLFDEHGRSDYLVAVVARDNPAHVVFESEAGAAAVALAQPDASTTLLGARAGPMFFFGRGRRGRDGREADDRLTVNVIEARRGENGTRIESRVFDANEGHWRLVAKHRAGSLEAAVGAARTRNFILSSGILALLAAAISLIVVSARRADRLARQQLEFVAAVSHELRTPVSVIGAAAGNLADGVVDEPSRVKKYGATIQGEARRLAETVERVLQLAGIASGRTASARQHVAVSKLVHDALAASQFEIDKGGLTIELDLPADLPGIDGDEVALRSALQNLISNAIKYGGDTSWVRIAASASGDRLVRISVADRGLGVAHDDRKHIFEPFYRGREAVSRQIQGSGLGLHLVRRIVEAHGGAVTVQSESGDGSVFTIELPAARRVVMARESSLPHAEPQTR